MRKDSHGSTSRPTQCAIPSPGNMLLRHPSVQLTHQSRAPKGSPETRPKRAPNGAPSSRLKGLARPHLKPTEPARPMLVGGPGKACCKHHPEATTCDWPPTGACPASGFAAPVAHQPVGRLSRIAGWAGGPVNGSLRRITVVGQFEIRTSGGAAGRVGGAASEATKASRQRMTTMATSTSKTRGLARNWVIAPANTR